MRQATMFPPPTSMSCVCRWGLWHATYVPVYGHKEGMALNFLHSINASTCHNNTEMIIRTNPRWGSLSFQCSSMGGGGVQRQGRGEDPIGSSLLPRAPAHLPMPPAQKAMTQLRGLVRQKWPGVGVGERDGKERHGTANQVLPAACEGCLAPPCHAQELEVPASVSTRWTSQEAGGESTEQSSWQSCRRD